MRRQGEVLDGLIRAELGGQSLSILDCSAGIGTQAIGLALCGHELTATDLSPNAIRRASEEAETFGVSIAFGVADDVVWHMPGASGYYQPVVTARNGG